MAGHIKAEVVQAQDAPEEPPALRPSLFTDTEAEKKEAPPPRPKPPPREAQPSGTDARDGRLDEAAWGRGKVTAVAEAKRSLEVGDPPKGSVVICTREQAEDLIALAESHGITNALALVLTDERWQGDAWWTERKATEAGIQGSWTSLR
eukprot:1559240-Alexandrium_andersonii.AAC.1